MSSRIDTITDDTIATLIAVEAHGSWGLEDPDGGVWWPAADAATEAAVRMAYQQQGPMAGVWHS